MLLTALAILLILRIAWAPRLGVYLILMQVITTCLALLFSPAIILAQLPLAAGIGLLTVLGSEFLLTLDLRRPC
ncbi:hypothetical protein AUJ68_06915 [Candidatus Woesearchaeota archaeon CG1_02_57_44]|nr:MAG: hypothetical protein AUJ68_06915 [Candidatus Woesearchaeota archaeon CG1_02_57_44]